MLGACVSALQRCGVDTGAFNQEKSLYVDASQPLGKFLPQLHAIAEGEESGLRDAHGTLMPPCIIMEKGEALDVWIENSGDSIDLFTGLQVRPLMYIHVCHACSRLLSRRSCAHVARS